MLLPGHIVRCPCFWPRDPENCSSVYGYLVPGPRDILRVMYVGSHRTDDHGWLFCRLVCEAPVTGPPDPSRAPPCGWVPAWAVVRLRPPGPMWRRAWDGRRYHLSAWMHYYGEDAGLHLWERAPH